MNVALLRVLKWPPNIITVSRFIIVGGAALVSLLGASIPRTLILTLLLYGYWLSDHLDGWVARSTGTSSRFGEQLDIAADRFCDIALSVWAIVVCPSLLWFILIFLVLRIPFDPTLPGVHEGWSLVTLRLPWLTFLQKQRVHDILAAAFHLIRSSFFISAVLGYPQPLIGYLLCGGSILYLGALTLKLELLARNAETVRGDSDCTA